jgi:hypothetical protein
MADLLGEGMAWLKRQLRDHASVLVTYRRGNASVEVRATLGISLLRVQDGHGETKVERIDRDFIIAKEDLVLNGQPTEPEDGDKIDLGDVRYEVMPVGSDPAWRYTDPYENQFRIHTKYRGQV